MREPRAFEVCRARRWRRSRRSQGGRGRGLEGGLKVTVREEETRREVGHEGRIRGEERTHGARQRAWKVYTEKKLDQTVHGRRLTNGQVRTAGGPEKCACERRIVCTSTRRRLALS